MMGWYRDWWGRGAYGGGLLFGFLYRAVILAILVLAAVWLWKQIKKK